MSAGFPLGVFARGRRDWSISQLMIGSYAAQGGGNSSLFSLNNNTNAGNYLAVYGVLAWRAFSVKLMAATTVNGLAAAATGTNAVTQSLVPGMPAIDGYVGFGAGSFGTNAAGVIFWADGTHWLTMGDLPLFVLAPNQRLQIMYSEIIGNAPENEPQSCTFVWGYYTGAKPPQLAPIVAPAVQLTPIEES